MSTLRFPQDLKTIERLVAEPATKPEGAFALGMVTAAAHMAAARAPVQILETAAAITTLQGAEELFDAIERLRRKAKA